MDIEGKLKKNLLRSKKNVMKRHMESNHPYIRPKLKEILEYLIVLARL